MKVLGLVGSPRERNTKTLVTLALAECKKLGIETELVHLGKMDIAPCVDCERCRKEGRCAIDDDFQAVADKLEQADGVIIGSPVYFGCVSAQLKAFMDRTRYLRRSEKLNDKVGGAIATGGSRNGGQELVIRQIHNFFLIQGMLVAGDEKTMHFGGASYGDATSDREGRETSRNVGRHVAQVVLKLKKN